VNSGFIPSPSSAPLVGPRWPGEACFVHTVWTGSSGVGYVSFSKAGGRFLENASHVLQSCRPLHGLDCVHCSNNHHRTIYSRNTGFYMFPCVESLRLPATTFVLAYSEPRKHAVCYIAAPRRPAAHCPSPIVYTSLLCLSLTRLSDPKRPSQMSLSTTALTAAKPS
jgi:hypothetical protein